MALSAGFSEIDVFTVEVAHLTDGSLGVHGNHPNFARGETDLRIARLPLP